MKSETSEFTPELREVRRTMRQFLATTLMAAITFGPLTNANAAAPAKPAPAKSVAGQPATPIQHLVVIFQENVSFDHYFGTYPNATNPAGEPPFTPLNGTPAVNGILGTLSTANPNLNPANGQGATNPFRLDRSQAATNDQDHDYTPEQLAFDNGLMDLFPANTGVAGPPPAGRWNGGHHRPGHGLLRRQHGHRSVELRSVLRDER